MTDPTPDGTAPDAAAQGSGSVPEGSVSEGSFSESLVPENDARPPESLDGGVPGEADAGPVDAGSAEAASADVDLPGALEAVLLVVDEPVQAVTLAQVLERPTREVAAALGDLAARYASEGRGFDLREVAGGWRFYTREEYAPVVERFLLDGQQARLTQAALETLAVVAYRQPVSRARVAAVRGVNVDGVMRTLVTRGLVEETGTDPESGAILYRTTSYFLERLGLRGLDELPDLAPHLPALDEFDEVADAAEQR